VEDMGHFNNAVFAAAIEKEMSRTLHPWTAHSGSAQRKVVSPRAPDHDLGSVSRSWTLGIGSDVLFLARLRLPRFIAGASMPEQMNTCAPAPWARNRRLVRWQTPRGPVPSRTPNRAR
jgi:hypothetical protein